MSDCPGCSVSWGKPSGHTGHVTLLRWQSHLGHSHRVLMTTTCLLKSSVRIDMILLPPSFTFLPRCKNNAPLGASCLPGTLLPPGHHTPSPSFSFSLRLGMGLSGNVKDPQSSSHVGWLWGEEEKHHLCALGRPPSLPR